MDTIDTSRTYALFERVLLKEDGDLVLAFDPETLAVHQFNESLTTIAKALDGTQSCEQIVILLVENYGLEVAEASKEVYRALETLIEHKLIKPV